MGGIVRCWAQAVLEVGLGLENCLGPVPDLIYKIQVVSWLMPCLHETRLREVNVNLRWVNVSHVNTARAGGE